MNDFNLISELFDNVVLFNPDLSVISKGSIIDSLLRENGFNVEDLRGTTPGGNAELHLLKNALTEALISGEPAAFKFECLPDEFTIFPNDDGRRKSLFFGLRGKLVQIIEIEHKLKARMHELRCLYNVTKELDAEQTLAEAFDKCIQHIKNGFLFPEGTFVSIIVGGKRYGGTDWDIIGIKDILSVDLKSEHKKVGELRIYLKHKSGFLPEQLTLIEEVAGEFSRAIERDEKEKNLQKQQKILKAKNDKLLKLTDECRQSREKLHTFFKAITDKIVVVDHEFNIVLSNNDEIGDNGKCYHKLFGLQARCALCPAMSAFTTLKNAAVERVEGENYISLQAYPILNKEGLVESVLEVCSDITRHKKMEAQLLQTYKLASLGKLVAGVAHEINNPNTFILGNLTIFEESLTDILPVLDEYYNGHPDFKIARLPYEIFKENITILVKDMIGGANRTKKIVDDLKNFAKKDDDLFTDDIEINTIITNNFTLTRKHVKKYARLDVQLGEGIPVFKGNANKLEQVIRNIILNAADACVGVEGIISVISGYDSSLEEVVVEITDNGCGMSESTLKNIFDPFFTTKRNSGGTGLGLSICYEIIKDHAGRIDVDSKPGQGAKFTIRIPVRKI